MRIKLLNGLSPTELRGKLPDSKFFYSDFDQFIIGYETNLGSVIYDLEEVIKFMINIENPHALFYSNYEDFQYVYDETFKKLVKTNSLIGIKELKKMVEYNAKNPSKNNPYAFCWMDEIMEWIITRI